MIITNGYQNNEMDIRHLWEECFDEDSITWQDWYFEHIFDIDNVICAKKANHLVSMVHMNPYPLLLHHSKVKSFALSGVATEQEHRGQGYAGSLIKYALNKAYKLGYDFSFLYPFKYEYYQKFGYSLAYYKHKYKTIYIDKNQQSNIAFEDMYSLVQINKIYAAFVNDKNGFILRDSAYCDIHIKELECDHQVKCFTIGNQKGYFAINDKEDIIEELAFEGSLETAINEISNYYKKSMTFENLYNVDSMINIQEKHCMGRVISVKRLLSKLKMKDADITIKIIDDIIEENNNIWHIKSSGGRTTVEKSDIKPDYKIDISYLAPILTGVSTGNEEVDKIQELLFKKTEAFIYEVC